MAVAGTGRSRRFFLILSLVANLGVLGFFKYFNFFSESLVSFLGLFGMQAHPVTVEVILPVGISFYTFQALSYTIDVYRGALVPTSSFRHFALYLSFFPQLVAGPIERAANLLPQIEALDARVTGKLAWQGALLVASGYFKKVALGDQIVPEVDRIFASWASVSPSELWRGAVLFWAQVYFDFSGYTDIARGVAKWFGIDLMVNFRQPYYSASPVEFWRRWHISLSSWLRDYVYIPLGGNRRGSARTAINLMVTMLLAGLWHGANLTFVIWGLLHGAFLSIQKWVAASPARGMRLPRPLGIGLTNLLIILTLVFFRAPNMDVAWGVLAGMADLRPSSPFGPLALPLVVAVLMFAMDWPLYRSGDELYWMRLPRWGRIALVTIAAVVVLMLLLDAEGPRPFVYFQF